METASVAGATPRPVSARSDLVLPTLGYGAANVGNLYRELSDEAAHAVLEAAWAAGIRYFDTAPHYGLGLSERRLGAFLATKPRDEFVVSTKVGRLLVPSPATAGELDLDNDFHVPADVRREWDFSPAGIRASLEASLTRMGLERIDVLYLHDPDRADPDRDLPSGIEGLTRLKEEGLVRAVGLGAMSTPVLAAGAASGALDLLMIAGRFTLAEQPALETVLPACRASGTGVVTASVFNSGLLASDTPDASGRYEYGGVPPELLAKVQAIAAIARDAGVRLPAAAIQYTLREDAVRSVVVGSSRAAQIAENAALAAAPIPEAFWTALAEAGLIPAATPET